MGTSKLQSAFAELETMGWFTGWGLSCCSSCAWMDVPDCLPSGEETDLSKVLFNHEQDCEKWNEEEWFADQRGHDDEEDEFIQTNTWDEQTDSCFCFDGSKKGVKNLKAILPVFEKHGVQVSWSGKGAHRIELDWSDSELKYE